MLGREYVVIRKNTVHFYGPFESRDLARAAAYFLHSVEERDSSARAGRFFDLFDTQLYDDAEIESIKKWPSEFFDEGRVVFHKKVDIHPSWRAFHKDFRQEIFLRDWHSLQWQRGVING